MTNSECKPLAVGVYQLALRDYLGIKRFLSDETEIRRDARHFIKKRFTGKKTTAAEKQQLIRILLAFANLVKSETEAFLKSKNLWGDILGINGEIIAAKLKTENFDEQMYTPFNFNLLDSLRVGRIF